MFGWDFEDDAWSRFWRWNLICVWTCDKNSTLGSVVPLAMFVNSHGYLQGKHAYSKTKNDLQVIRGFKTYILSWLLLNHQPYFGQNNFNFKIAICVGCKVGIFKNAYSDFWPK